MASARITLPPSVTKGMIVPVKAIISHPMEPGHRRGMNDEIIPRNIITELSAVYDGEEVFAAMLFPAIAAFPLIGFTFIATVSGPLVITWRGDNDFSQSESAMVMVTG